MYTQTTATAEYTPFLVICVKAFAFSAPGRTRFDSFYLDRSEKKCFVYIRIRCEVSISVTQQYQVRTLLQASYSACFSVVEVHILIRSCVWVSFGMRFRALIVYDLCVQDSLLSCCGLVSVLGS